MFTACTAVIVVKENLVLLGYRSDGQGWSLAGGKQEPEEDLETCAKRELHEEFGLVATQLESLGRIHSSSLVRGVPLTVHPMVYLCREYTGSVHMRIEEMLDFQWISLDQARQLPDLYPPTREALHAYSEQIQKRC